MINIHKSLILKLPEGRFKKADHQHPIMPGPPFKDSSVWASSLIRQNDHSGMSFRLRLFEIPDSRLRALSYRPPRAPISSIQQLGENCLVRCCYPTTQDKKRALTLTAKTLCDTIYRDKWKV